MYSILEELDKLNTDTASLTEMYAHHTILPYRFSEASILDPKTVVNFILNNATPADEIEIGVYTNITDRFSKDCIDTPEAKVDPHVPPFDYTVFAYEATQHLVSLAPVSYSSKRVLFTSKTGTTRITNYYFEFEANKRIHNLDILSKTAIYYPHEFKQLLSPGSALTPQYTCQHTFYIDPYTTNIFYVGIAGKGAIGHPAAGKPALDTTKTITKQAAAMPSKPTSFVSDLELTGIAREAFPDVLEEVLTNMKLFTSFQVDNALTFTGKLSGKETDIDVLRLTLEKWDEDDGKLTLLLDKTILDHSDQIQLAAAIKQVLIDEGYGQLAFIKAVSRPYKGRQLCEVMLRYII